MNADIKEGKGNPFLSQDICRIAEADLPFEKLRGKCILVTGGNGLIGSVLTGALSYINRIYSLDIKVVTVSRRRGSSIRIDIAKQSFYYNKTIDYVFHTASLTASNDFITSPVETIDIAVNGTLNTLKTAQKCGARRFIYISSQEVYGSDDPREIQDDSSPQGGLDLTSVRNSYPESKRLCELLCNSFMYEYGLDCRIARLAQVFGAGASLKDSRIFAQFARSIIRGEDIVLQTQGMSYGNYCYLSEAVLGLLYILLKGNVGSTYNVSNENNRSTIREMACIAAAEVSPQLTGKTLSVRIEETGKSFMYPRQSSLKLDSSQLRALGWTPEYSLADMYIRMLLPLI